jgi:hypothetical protein
MNAAQIALAQIRAADGWVLARAGVKTATCFEENELTLHLGRNRYVVVTYVPGRDTYNVATKKLKGVELLTVRETTDVYVDHLAECVERAAQAK